MTTSLREQLTAIYERHGDLTPRLVVDTARPPENPLHDRFEWDDQLAGESWRRHQAHDLIRTVRVTYREATETEPAKSVRAFHALPTGEGYVYRPAHEVAQDPLAAGLLRRDMERQWKELKRRYADFEEFWQLVRADAEESAA